MPDISAIIFLIIFGFILFLPDITNLLKKNKCTRSTSGKVVDITTSTSRTNHRVKTLYTPVIEYEANGHYYTQEYFISGNSCNYHMGDVVEIRYNPDDPADFIIYEQINVKKIISVLIILIVIYLLFFS